MQRCWRPRGLFPLALVVASISLPRSSHADVSAFPEISLYKTHNHIFRSRFATATTWSEEQGDFTTAAFEYDLDFGLGSFFRRYIFKDPNAEKSKFVTIRLGYAYLPDLTDQGGADERRVITDATFRFPLGNAWLLSDRNRVDFRQIGDVDSTRYRNRLRLERNIAIRRFRATPYSNAEAYYDNKLNKWNRADATVGAEFPWRYSTILEFYLTWQFERSVSDNQLLGFSFSKFL